MLDASAQLRNEEHAVAGDPRRTGAPAVRGEAGLRVVFGGRERTPVAVLGCDVLLAIDRPDTFEIRLLDRAPYFAGGDDRRPGPGTPFGAVARGENLFRGVIERVTFEATPEAGAVVVISACAPWRLLRGRRRPNEPPPASLRDLAWGLALDLGLEPFIDCPGVPLPASPAPGDPLGSLATIARELGLRLAVTSGRLHLGRGLPEPGSRHRITPATPLTRIEVEHRLGGEREARIRVAGLAQPRPLDAVALEDFGPERDAWYRVTRCHLSLRAAGWETSLEMEHLP